MSRPNPGDGYLNRFDHTVTSFLGFGGYARFCAVFGDDRSRLLDLRHQIDVQLAALRLRLHPRKTAVVPTAAGITCGHAAQSDGLPLLARLAKHWRFTYFNKC